MGTMSRPISGLIVVIVAVAAATACRKDEKAPENPVTKTADAQPETKPPAEPPPAEAAPKLDTSCATDNDCAPAPGCCPAPCTGEVINAKDLEKARAWVKKSCPKDIECPSAGGCPTHLYVCENSKCQITYAGEPAFEKRQAKK